MNSEVPEKYATQRQKMQRNMTIIDEWRHRYREGFKPITMNDLAIKFGLSKNRIWAIIKKYGENDNPENPS